MFQVSNNLIPLMRRTALSFTASAVIFAPIAHQGEWHQRPLNVRESRATPNLDRRYSVTPSRDSHAATSGPVVRITRAALARWSRVHVCEEGNRGWHVHGPVYFGGLGWRQWTWDQFRRADFPARADLATIAEQVWAAQQFAGFYHFVPDQHGCTGGY